MSDPRARRPAKAATERCRVFFGAWQGGPLTLDEIARLTGLPKAKPLNNAVEYLVRAGTLKRVEQGVYAPALGGGR